MLVAEDDELEAATSEAGNAKLGRQEFVIGVECVNEPPKSYIAERAGRVEYGPSVHDPSRVMAIRLTEDDLRL